MCPVPGCGLDFNQKCNMQQHVDRVHKGFKTQDHDHEMAVADDMKDQNDEDKAEAVDSQQKIFNVYKPQ